MAASCQALEKKEERLGSVPVNHDSVTMSQHAQNQDIENQELLNGIQPSLILLCTAVRVLLRHVKMKIFDGKGLSGKVTQVFEANGNKPEIVLTIVEPGYLLVLQEQESLDTIPLLCGSDSLKVHQKSDNLMFRFTVKGESHMIRMQFYGRSRAEAIKECSSAVEKLMEYMPVTTQDDTPLLPNQSPTEVSAPVLQTGQGKAMGVEPDLVQGTLSIKRLIQHLLGETAVTLPQVYRHCSLAQGDLEPFLRICLLDPSFHAFVEKVEGELRKLLEE